MPLAKESQIVDMETIVQTYIDSVKLPPGITVVSHEFMLAPVDNKIVLMLTISDESEKLKKIAELEDKLAKYADTES